MTQDGTVRAGGHLTILAMLGQILLIFLLANIILSPFPTMTSVAADGLATIVRILLAGLIVGMIGRRRVHTVWWYRLWAVLPLVVVTATVALLLAVLGQGRQAALVRGVAEGLRGLIECLLALWLASSIAKRGKENISKSEV
jgi:hypothetical protein